MIEEDLEEIKDTEEPTKELAEIEIDEQGIPVEEPKQTYQTMEEYAGDMDPADDIIEDFAEYTRTTEYEETKKEGYTVPKEISEYERLKILFLEDTKQIPTGPQKHINPIRNKIKDLLMKVYK